MKKKIGVIALAVAVMALTGCFSISGYRMGESKSKVQKAVTSGNWGSPKDSTVLFGSEYVDFGVYQQNPAFGYRYYQAQVNATKTGTAAFFVAVAKTKSLFFIQPLPRGSEIKIYGYRNAGAYNDTITYCGIQGVDFVLTKPGLMYYEKNDPEHKNEYESLKSMLPYFKGTDWEPVITERMEELSNESKKK